MLRVLRKIGAMLPSMWRRCNERTVSGNVYRVRTISEAVSIASKTASLRMFVIISDQRLDTYKRIIAEKKTQLI